MPVNITAAIDREIANLKERLSALRSARRVLGGRANQSVPTIKRRKRRKLTSEEKATISKRMKEAWKKRKAASKAT
jgi:hypothetical protein